MVSRGKKVGSTPESSERHRRGAMAGDLSPSNKTLESMNRQDDLYAEETNHEPTQLTCGSHCGSEAQSFDMPPMHPENQKWRVSV